MENCIFCKIVQGEIPSNKVYEDEYLIAFKDLSPVAPEHVLIVPKVHIDSLNEVDESHKALLGHLWITASKIAALLGVAENGYRIVNNCGTEGGQTVGHIHFHLMGGRTMKWPPG